MEIESKMRIFVCFGEERVNIDVTDGQTVYEVKEVIRAAFDIGPDEGPAGVEQHEKKILTLSCSGADLDDKWLFSDIGIQPGSTIKATLKDEVKPYFFVYSAFNDEIVPIYDRVNFRNDTVATLRGVVSRQTGLPVGVFRLLNSATPGGLEMYDCNSLYNYGVSIGGTVRMETWDGWSDFLNLCIMGYASHVLVKLSSDDVISKYQMKVALYMAAHFGHVDLAISLLRLGARADEAIGEHPLRMWCKAVSNHIDTFKAPVHEAAEAGQLGVLRSFVHNNMCNVLARDGNNLTPLNIALRKKQKPCASFLLTKQWSKISYTKKNSVPLSIFVKMKRWSERSKEKVLMIHGQWKSSVKNPRRMAPQGALLGHGVLLDGFSGSKLTSKPPSLARIEEDEEQRKKKRSWRLEEEERDIDAETYFKTINTVNALKLPRLSKWGKIMNKVVKEETSTDKERMREKELDKERERIAEDDESTITKDTRRLEQTGSTTPGKITPHPPPARKRVPRPRSNSTSRLDQRVRLPPIKEKMVKTIVSISTQNLATPADKSEPEFSSSKKAAYLKTGSMQGTIAWSSTRDSVSTYSVSDAGVRAKSDKDSGAKDTEAPKEGKTPRKKRQAPTALLSKAHALDGSMPLPMQSMDNNPRPFAKEEVTKETLDLFEKYRGIKSRDYAIKCLSVANSFKEKRWLQQVHQAMHIAAKGVKKIVEHQPYLFTPDVEAAKSNNAKKLNKTPSSDSLPTVVTV